MKKPFGSEILDLACRLIVPFVLLFALYILFHGHSSPGGGFQAGAILAAAIILINLIRGRGTRWGPDVRGSLWLATIGVTFFVLVGLAPVFFSAPFLDYSALSFGEIDPADVRHFWTFAVEIGIALTVTGVFLLIFYALVTRGEDLEGDPS